MLNKIQELKDAIEALQVSSIEEIEAARIKYLSKKGEISLLFNDFRTVPNELKREIGQKLNELKTLATDKINSLKASFEDSTDASAGLDLTRTSAPYTIGTRHPLSLVKEEIISIFLAISILYIFRYSTKVIPRYLLKAILRYVPDTQLLSLISLSENFLP